MIVPGLPAIQTCGPMTCKARKSNWSATPGGNVLRWSCHVCPRSLLTTTAPLSPTASALPSAIQRAARMEWVRFFGSPIVVRVTASTWPDRETSRGRLGMPKSASVHAALTRPGPLFQLRPPSRVRNKALGNIAQASPTAVPLRASSMVT